ncbi:hypothetical protein quinque_002259 [Culex quinquefasciatus]
MASNRLTQEAGTSIGTGMPSLAERRNQDKLAVTIEPMRGKSSEISEEAKDQPTDLKGRQERAVGLRRNSISMPTLTAEDLDALHQSRIDEEESSIMSKT